MKKVLVLIALFLLLIGIFPKQSVDAAGSFTDVKQYENEISFLVNKEIITGYKDGTFKPENDLNRLNAIMMILREKGITDFSAPNPGFTDMTTDTYGYDIVAKAVDMGFISGKTAANGSKFFDPKGTLTRGQMAKILVLAYDLPINNSYTFSDMPKDPTTSGYISTLASENITTGYQDGTFKPNGKISRQHFAVFMARQLDESFKPKPDLKVSFIDVGQGDSILIQAPNGKTMLIDGGTRAAGVDVVAYLRSRGVTKLDYVVATHPDADHIGGLISVLNSFTVGTFIDSGKVHTTETYLDILNLIDSKNISLTIPNIGEKFTLDPTMDIQIIHVNGEATDNNDASIVFKVTYNKVSFLLMGDADTKLEAEIMAKFNVQSTILKAGHHGSNTSSSATFINKVKPATTILSYGEDNSYGHPHTEVISRLKSVGSKIYSTAEAGNITVTTNGLTHSVSAKPWTGYVSSTPNPETKPAPTTPDLSTGTYVIPGAPTSFKNCTSMREYYPYGVKIGHPAYSLTHDRDKDNMACEQ
ncbi:S-layer homology domain-containing protein [Psychrobacillus psychrotolerans]|uniref:S-layer homology domain-containing protein n=1 Tax=Psychrobacillus psychrotolerans TaxID=126156 RepID=UPI003B01B8C5